MSSKEGWAEFREWGAFLFLTPLAVFTVRREDCQPSGSVCKGVFWLHGFTALFAIHYVSFAAAGVFLLRHGHGPGVWACLSPALAVWLVFGEADAKFRLQHRPTPEERGAFDDAVLNWFGAWAFFLGTFVVLPFVALRALLLLWHWLAAVLPALV